MNIVFTLKLLVNFTNIYIEMANVLIEFLSKHDLLKSCIVKCVIICFTAVMRCDRGVEVITVITALFFAGSDQMSCNAGIKHGNGR